MPPRFFHLHNCIQTHHRTINTGHSRCNTTGCSRIMSNVRKIWIALNVRCVGGLTEECVVYVVGSLMSANLWKEIINVFEGFKLAWNNDWLTLRARCCCLGRFCSMISERTRSGNVWNSLWSTPGGAWQKRSFPLTYSFKTYRAERDWSGWPFAVMKPRLSIIWIKKQRRYEPDLDKN